MPSREPAATLEARGVCLSDLRGHSAPVESYDLLTFAYLTTSAARLRERALPMLQTDDTCVKFRDFDQSTGPVICGETLCCRGRCSGRRVAWQSVGDRFPRKLVADPNVKPRRQRLWLIQAARHDVEAIGMIGRRVGER